MRLSAAPERFRQPAIQTAVVVHATGCREQVHFVSREILCSSTASEIEHYTAGKDAFP